MCNYAFLGINIQLKQIIQEEIKFVLDKFCEELTAAMEGFLSSPAGG